MKRLFFIIVAFLFVACSSELKQENNATNKRVFATMPALTALLEVLYPQGIIGLNYKPYPEDIKFMPENVANLPVLGLKERINYEAVVALKPDIIIFAKPLDKTITKAYEELGIKIIAVSAEFKDIEESIRLYAQHLGVTQRAEKLIAFHRKIKKRLDELRGKIIKKPRVYFAFGMEGLQTFCASKEHLDDDLAFQIGGENVIECDSFHQRLLPMNYEQIITLNPEVIFVREIALYEQLLNEPNSHWQRIEAVKNKRIYYAPSSPSNWLHKPPTIMRILGYPWAFSKLHPELLSEKELESLVKDFFANFLRPLSDEDYEGLK